MAIRGTRSTGSNPGRAWEDLGWWENPEVRSGGAGNPMSGAGMNAFYNAAGGDRLQFGQGGMAGTQIPLPGGQGGPGYEVLGDSPFPSITAKDLPAAGGNWLQDLANMLGKGGGWKDTLQDLALGVGLGAFDKIFENNPTKPFGQSGMQDVDAYTNPDMALARAFKTGYSALGDLGSRDYSQYAVPAPEPVSVPGVPFQIGGGLGLDPSFWQEMGNMAQTSALAQQYTQPGPTQRRTGHDPLSTAPPSRGQARRREV